DVLAGVDFDAARSPASGWWLRLELAEPDGEGLGASEVLVSPPMAPGDGRGVGANLGADLEGEVCGLLRWRDPTGALRDGDDLGCARAPERGCSVTGRPGSAAWGLVGVAVGMLAGRRRRSASPAA